MSRSRQRVLTSLVIAASGLLVGALGGSDIYVDAVVEGNPLWTTLVENTVTLGIGLALLGAAYWCWTAADRLEITRIRRWLVITVAAVAVASAVIGLAQSFQTRFKPLLFVTSLAGLAILGGLAIGRRDAASIAQRRTVERERDKFQALFENVPNPVIAVQFEGETLHAEGVNPAFEEVFGYAESDLAGRDLREVLRPPGEEPERIDGSERSVAPQSTDGGDGSDWREVEITLETDYGEREFVRVSAPVDTAAVDEEEYAYYVDVTERKQRRERLQVLSRTLRHDIRNRMEVAYGTAEVLEEDLDGEQESLAMDIQSAIDDLQRISEQTREVEQVVSGEYDTYPADLDDLVRAELDDLQEMYPEVTISVDLGETPPVRANEALPVAVRNIVENAVVHHDSNSPSVTVRAADSRDGFVALQIADDGPGIPERERAIVTDEREQTQLEHTDGLGLWEVNWVLRDLGGSLEFSDNEPRGSVVTLRLPTAERSA